MSKSVEHKDVYFRVPEALADDIEQLRYEKSGPSTDVTKASVIRAAARDYIKKHSENLRVCDPASRGDLGGGSSKRAGSTFEKPEHEKLKEVAYELSDPGSKVSVSQVLRAALRDYIEKHEDGVRDVHPVENGGLVSPFR